MRLIAHLGGQDAASITAQALGKPGLAYDVLRQTWTRTLVDPYAVVATALDASVSAAMTAITAEAVIRRAS